MKTTIIATILAITAIVGTCYTVIRSKEAANAKLENEARKAEAEQREAAAKEKAASLANAKARSEEATAKRKAEAARDERITAEKRAEEAKADEKTAADQKATAEAEAKTAAAQKARAEAEAKTAADRRAEAEALAAHALATNETRQAELRLAESARLAVEADIRRTEAENKAAELKKLDLDKRLAEVAELQETLRQREEATRPERTINDIIAANDRRRAEEEAAAAAEEEKRLAELAEKDYAAYEAEMERRRKINRYGVAGPDAKPLSAAEKLVKNAEDELKRTTDEGRAAAQKRIVVGLEREIRAALAERRIEDAEFLMKNLLMLVPEHKFRQ
ncbi:MAG: hypothetical protein IKO72_08355 [Kiritimatiellae bacterium]|nr:hypothetical protein [Kiritimatiellia bacterium]